MSRMMVRAGVMPCLATILGHLALLQLATVATANTFNFTQEGVSAVLVSALTISFNTPECDDDQYWSPITNCTSCLTYKEECKKEAGVVNPCCEKQFLACKFIQSNEYRCQCEDSSLSWENGICMRRGDYDNRMQFMTAAQVALGAALVIAVSALSALTCKMCSSRRRLAEARRQESDAASLNSVQRFVLQRLRDRPPRYDENNVMPDKPPAYAEISATLPTPSVPQTNLHRILRAHRRPVSPPAYAPAVGETIASFPQPSTSTDNPTTLMQPPDSSGNGEPPPDQTVTSNEELPEYTEMNHKELTIEIPVIVNEVSELTPEVTCPEISECSEDSPVFIVEVADDTPLTIPEENTVTGVMNPAFNSPECHM